MNDNIGKTVPVALAISPVVLQRVQQILDENDIHFVIINSDLQAYVVVPTKSQIK